MAAAASASCSGVTAAGAPLVDVVFIAVAQPKDQRGRVTVDSDWSK